MILAAEAVAAASVVAVAVLTSVAAAFVLLSTGLSVAAFAIWFRNRENLRALDELLREKAHAGMAALKEVDGV